MNAVDITTNQTFYFVCDVLFYVVMFVLTLLPILIAVAYIILAERKVMASIQRRKGPNVVGLFGLLQPFIDAVKLVLKEHIYPSFSNLLIFIVAPMLSLVISLLAWCFIPFQSNNFYFNYQHSLLFVLAFSSISVYGITLSGWASNSRFAILGAIRTIAQFISYELVLTICILPIVLYTGSLNLIDIVQYQITTTWFILPFWPLAYIFFISALAETNRTPFDLPEAEAELVAGYNVEYSSVFFIFFMFAEYNSVLTMSALFSILFLGGWDGIFFQHEVVLAIKIALVSFVFIVVRATQPRFRFDQLLNLCWKKLIPLSFGLFLFSIPLLLVLEVVTHSEFTLVECISIVPFDFWVFSGLAIVLIWLGLEGLTLTRTDIFRFTSYYVSLLVLLSVCFINDLWLTVQFFQFEYASLLQIYFGSICGAEISLRILPPRVLATPSLKTEGGTFTSTLLSAGFSLLGLFLLFELIEFLILGILIGSLNLLLSNNIALLMFFMDEAIGIVLFIAWTSFYFSEDGEEKIK